MSSDANQHSPASILTGSGRGARRAWLDGALAGAVFAILAAVYLRTLLPGVGGTEDSPKFQYVGALLGVPHNPGYPLYMLACYAFSKLPIGALAYRINLLSAFWGATCGALVFLSMRCLKVQRGIAVAVAVGLGLGSSFWAHSVFAEAYTQSSALAAATILAALKWDHDGREGWLYAAVVCASLAFGTHLITAGAAPVLVWFVLDRYRWRPPVRVLATSAAIVAAGVAQYGYVWIRTVQRARYLESSAKNFGELVDVMLARQFGSQILTESPLVVLHTRLPGIGRVALVELGAIAAIAAVIGVAALWSRNRRAALLLALGAACPAMLLSVLGPVATAGILLPALVPCWILSGAGFAAAWNGLASRERRPVLRAAGLVCVGFLAASVPAAQAWRNFDENDHHDDTYDDDYVVSLFNMAPRRAAFVDDGDYRFVHTLKYQQYVTGAKDILVSVAREPDRIERLLAGGYAVFAFQQGLDALDGRVRVQPITLPGLPLDEQLRRVRDGRVVVIAGSAAEWPSVPSLRLGARAVQRGRAVVVAVKGAGPAIVTPTGFEGTVWVTRGQAVGPTAMAAPANIAIDVRGDHAAIAVDGQPVVETESGLVVAEVGPQVDAAYVIRPDDSFRPPLPRQRPLYRIVEVTPASSCRDIGDGAWSALANPGTEARMIGRIRNAAPFDAVWLVYLVSPQPLPARLADWAGPAVPALSVEALDPQRDAARLRARLAADGIADAAPFLTAPSVTRLEVKVRDDGKSSVFRINLGGRPDRAWARALVDAPGPGLASVCAGAVEPLRPDSAALKAAVHLGPDGDWFFGSGWRKPELAIAGNNRQMAGSDATLLLPIDQPAAITLRLSVQAASGARAVALKLNGRDLPPRPLAAGWNELAWPLDAAAWRAGINDLSLHVVKEPRGAGGAAPAPALGFRSIVLDWGGGKE